MTPRDHRPARTESCDVLVVGGGAAGVAAAVTAARAGLSVTLIERYGFCGGGAVAGLSGTICGMYLASESPESPPRPLVHGFLDEFVARMERADGLTGPVRYGKTFTRVHDPLAWRDVADTMLREAGVRVIYHATVTEVLAGCDEVVEGVLAYTKEGKRELRAALTIDASGDADLVAMSGLPFTMGRDGQVQNPTMIFRLLGCDPAQLHDRYGPDSIMPAATAETIQRLHARGDYYLPRAKIFLFPTPRPGELLCNATRLIGRDGRELCAVVADDLTEAEFEGRRQVREYARFIRDHVEGCAGAWVNDTGVQVGVRQTRQVCGVTTLTNADVEGCRKRDDGVARSAWPIELHKGDKPKLVWLIDDYYEIPFGCFVPVRGENLLVTGRCLAAEHEAMASARVTAQCFEYGHAVGHAAALAVRERLAVRDIPGSEIRRRVNAHGARLD